MPNSTATTPVAAFDDTDRQLLALLRENARLPVADLARRHGLHPQQLYTWRRQAKRGELVLRDEDMRMFAAVVAAEPFPAEPGPGSRPGDDHLLVLEFGEMRLRIGPDVVPERVAALVAALRIR